MQNPNPLDSENLNSKIDSPPPLSDPDSFLRLARLSIPEYDRCRAAEAARLKIRLRTLDAEVARLRANIEHTAADAEAVNLKDVAPWPEPVDGPQVALDVSARYSNYIVLWDHAADALSLWTFHTHCYTAFFQTPRLNLFSKEHGCGKSTTLDVLKEMVPRPFKADNVRAPVIFRIAHRYHPTLLLDEVDTYLPETNELRGLLNAGYKPDGVAYRCEGLRRAVLAFKACAPTAVAGIGILPPTLHDRSIFIPMVAATENQPHQRFDPRKVDTEHLLASKIARWTKDNFEALKNCDPPLPPEAFNRLGDNWRPLFMIAHVLGGDWPERARAAFYSLKAGAEQILSAINVPPFAPSALSLPRSEPAPTLPASPLHDSPTPHSAPRIPQLLNDLRRLFEQTNVPALHTMAIIAALCQMPDRPYAQMAMSTRSGYRLTPTWLGRQLAAQGILSTVVKIGAIRARAYLRESFIPPTRTAAPAGLAAPEPCHDPQNAASPASSLAISSPIPPVPVPSAPEPQPVAETHSVPDVPLVVPTPMPPSAPDPNQLTSSAPIPAILPVPPPAVVSPQPLALSLPVHLL